MINPDLYEPIEKYGEQMIIENITEIKVYENKNELFSDVDVLKSSTEPTFSMLL